MTETPGADQEYTEQLGAVLQRRDPEALRSFLVESAQRFGDAAQVAQITQQPAAALEMMMHRMIVSRLDLAALHADSQQWLKSRGFDAPKAKQPPKPRRAPGPAARPHQPKRL
jgi:hypothetical protein